MSVHVLLNSADATAAEFATTVDGLTLIELMRSNLSNVAMFGELLPATRIGEIVLLGGGEDTVKLSIGSAPKSLASRPQQGARTAKFQDIRAGH
jgi:hypothetical protein